jgi:hypothetical protein
MREGALKQHERDADHVIFAQDTAIPFSRQAFTFPCCLVLMCARSSAHPEIITTSGSILSLLSRDQDVTMRPQVSIVISGRPKHGLDSQSTPPCLSSPRGIAGLLI